MTTLALNVSESRSASSPSSHQRKSGSDTSLEPTLLGTIHSPKRPLISLWPLGLSKITPEFVGVCKPMTVNRATIPNLCCVASTGRCARNWTSLFCHYPHPNLTLLFQRLVLAILTQISFNSTFIYTLIYIYVCECVYVKLEIIFKHGACVNFLILRITNK